MKYREEIKVRQYVMVIEEEAEGGLSGTFPDVPGCFTQGESMEELLANAEDALQTHLTGPDGEWPAYPGAQIPHGGRSGQEGRVTH